MDKVSFLHRHLVLVIFEESFSTWRTDFRRSVGRLKIREPREAVPTDMMNNKMTPGVFIVVFSSDFFSKLYSFSRISFLFISKHKKENQG